MQRCRGRWGDEKCRKHVENTHVVVRGAVWARGYRHKLSWDSEIPSTEHFRQVGSVVQKEHRQPRPHSLKANMVCIRWVSVSNANTAAGTSSLHMDGVGMAFMACIGQHCYWLGYSEFIIQCWHCRLVNTGKRIVRHCLVIWNQS